MKRFKRNYYTALLLMFFSTIMLMVASCGDDDGGPSRSELLVGTWVLERFNGDRVDADVEVRFEADGDFTESEDGLTDRGEWQLKDNDTVIEVDYGGGDEEEFEIIVLTSDVLLLEDEGNNDIEFEKK